MEIDRYQHGCAVMKVGEKRFAVVAGGYSTQIGGMPKVELLELETMDQWKAGPDMPFELMEFTMTTLADGAVLAVGGRSGRDFMGSLVKFSCQESIENCTWEEMEQTLAVPRKEHVALLIPDVLSNCSSVK